MDNRLFFKTLDEIRQQCRFAQLAFQNVQASLNEQDPERVFLHVHAFLNHATTISRFLSPARPESKQRGDRLLQELKIATDSPLLLQGVRRQVERFDEAFEDWLSSLDEPNYVEMNLMPTGTMSGFKADTFQRSLDPDTHKLHLRGVECDLRKVADEIRKLDTTIQQWLRTHNPW